MLFQTTWKYLYNVKYFQKIFLNTLYFYLQIKLKFDKNIQNRPLLNNISLNPKMYFRDENYTNFIRVV